MQWTGWHQHRCECRSSDAVHNAMQVGGELIADLRAQIPHWAVLREASASRSRPDSLLASDPRISTSDWPDGAQACTSHSSVILLLVPRDGWLGSVFPSSMNTSDWPIGAQACRFQGMWYGLQTGCGTFLAGAVAWLKTTPRCRFWASGRHDGHARLDSCMQVWELMGTYLVNQTFATEWGFPVDRGPDDVIPNDVGDPNLKDGWVPVVRLAAVCLTPRKCFGYFATPRGWTSACRMVGCPW